MVQPVSNRQLHTLHYLIAFFTLIKVGEKNLNCVRFDLPKTKNWCFFLCTWKHHKSISTCRYLSIIFKTWPLPEFALICSLTSSQPPMNSITGLISIHQPPVSLGTSTKVWWGVSSAKKQEVTAVLIPLSAWVRARVRVSVCICV